jgi:thiol-disulfide isomerase/thioredoxin
MFASLVLFSCAKKEEPAKDALPQATEQQQNGVNKNNTIDVPANNAENVFTVGAVVPQTAKSPVDFAWKDATGDKKFSELAKGKVLLVNFWGTWCPPCRAEIPDLIQISKDLKDKEFIMIGVALERNPEQAVQLVNNFVLQSGIPYIVFVDEQTKLVEEYAKNFGAIEGVPTTYIFDKNAKLSQVIVGKKTKDEFMSYINKLL